mmetsp:Transcript_46441/g.75811  ORF Transcript_46441/g.75811 Transcript_46441/m.75811 type:complete len:340 (+) Transcript_46441:61-1080(+)
MQDASMYQPTVKRQRIEPEESPVLLVSVLKPHPVFPTTVEVLYNIFSKQGTISKIQIFKRTNESVQAFIEFVDRASAKLAKLTFEGQAIFAPYCLLRMHYSNHQTIQIKQPNEDSKDYFATPGFAGHLGGAPGSQQHSMGYGAPQGVFMGQLMPPGQEYGGFSMPSMQTGPRGMKSLGLNGTGSVLIVNGIDTQVTPDMLFTLFGVYGDVVRVKILYNRRDTAFVQFSTPEQASLARENLNQVPLFGKRLNVNFSKHTTVALPNPATASNDLETQMALTKDFANSPVHRFRNPNSKNFKHITPPSAMLHVSNIPMNATEEELQLLFSGYGPVIAFKFME